jgi:hypothetical protein
VRPEWLAVWSVPAAHPKQAEKIAIVIGRRVRKLVAEDPELLV